MFFSLLLNCMVAEYPFKQWQLEVERKWEIMLGTGIFTYFLPWIIHAKWEQMVYLMHQKMVFVAGGLEFTASIFIVEIPRGMGTLRFKSVFKWSKRFPSWILFLLRLPIGIHGNIPLSAWRHHLFVRLRKELEIENRMLNCPDRNERNYGMEHYHNSNFQELGQDISNTRSAPLCLQQVFKGCGGYGT